MNKQTYIEHLKKIIVGKHKPENVILLEIEPDKQNTAIDFYGCSQLLGIKVLDLNDLKKAGRDLYYLEGGKKIAVHRIYNRVIFDELEQRTRKLVLQNCHQGYIFFQQKEKDGE